MSGPNYSQPSFRIHPPPPPVETVVTVTLTPNTAPNAALLDQLKQFDLVLLLTTVFTIALVAGILLGRYACPRRNPLIRHAQPKLTPRSEERNASSLSQ
jgi:hypothetical protein